MYLEQTKLQATISTGTTESVQVKEDECNGVGIRLILTLTQAHSSNSSIDTQWNSVASSYCGRAAPILWRLFLKSISPRGKGDEGVQQSKMCKGEIQSDSELRYE